jgi:hypothetical protein
VSILKTILDAVGARRRERPVCIFDLDGTLYENRPRTLRILHAVAASLESEHRDDASAILALSWQDLAYRVEDTLRPRGVSEVVIERCVAAWRKKFFTDTACSDDIPQRGAVRFVRQCYDRGATVVYLTGRDIPGMLVGTVRTLRDDGFPIGVPRTELVLEPTFEESDITFKEGTFDALDELGTVIATFENEPGNANKFLARWPSAYSIFVATQWAPGAPDPDQGVVTVTNFEE